MHLRVSNKAETELREIKDYLEPRSPQGYRGIITAIFAAFDQLEFFPFLGRVGEVDDTRELVVPRTPYIIIYTLPDDYNIDVEHVLHGAMKYPPEDDA